jgi:uroporphyrinogen decarboxylase
LIRTLHEFYLREFSLWAETDVDALYIMDDWGGQRAMLISPVLWREIFKPLYAAYIDIAHDAGKYMFMHSDGYITDIVPDLIELGLDALNSQIFCMGVEELGARFGGKITFWGELDRQQLLAHGSRDEIIAAARRMRDCFYRDGGLIAQCEFGAGANPDNVRTFFEFWDRFSKV